MRFLPFSTVCSRDIAVDFGTANTVLCAYGGEMVVSEPSLVARDARSGGVLGAGIEALELLGRDGVAAIRPLEHGMIVDLPSAGEMLRHLISKVCRRGRTRPRVVASVASTASAVQRRAVREACLTAGARQASLVAKPIAAALAAGLPLEEPTGSMVLDIGAGSCEVAVISMARIVASRLIHTGGDEFDRRIITHLKRAHQVRIGEHKAQEIKIEVGSASASAREAPIEILGRDIGSEKLRCVRLTTGEIHATLESPLTRIIETTKEILARTPPQLACDIMDRGITLTGGSSLLHGLPDRLRLETGLPARVTESPCTCIAIGSARTVETQPHRRRPYAASPPTCPPRRRTLARPLDRLNQ